MRQKVRGIPVCKNKMADSVKYSILGDPIHPEDITLRFVSNFWPEKEIIIYDKCPFSLIASLLYRDIEKRHSEGPGKL